MAKTPSLNKLISELELNNVGRSIYKVFDAEDSDVTGFNNVSISSSSPIDDTKSYTISTFPADFGAITLDERNKNKINTVSVHHSLTSGSADLVIKDNAANELARLTIDSTVTKEATVSFYVADAVTSVTLSVEDNTAATGLKLDDIIFTDDPFVNKNLIKQFSVIATGNAGESITADVTDIPWVATSDLDGLWDGSGFTATKKGDYTAIGMVRTTANLGNIIQAYIDGTLYESAGTDAGTNVSKISITVPLEAGERLSFRSNGSGTLHNLASFHNLQITATAETENVVHHKAGTENTFSARIANNGTASITSFDVDFIDSVNRSSTGIVDIVFKSGFFSVTPSVTASGDGNNFTGYSTLSTSGVTVVTYQNTTNPALIDDDFTVTVKNQGTDYKQPNAFAVTPTSQVAYLKDVKTSDTNGGTSTSNTVHTRDLNTVEGDVNIVSLTGNQFTLPAGTYHIEASAPGYRSQEHQVFLYNDTTSTYDIDGESMYANNVNFVNNRSSLAGIIEITSPTTYEIRHWFSEGNATNGLGVAAGHASNPQSGEVYTQVRLEKVK